MFASTKTWGFLTLTIDKKTISGVATEVNRDGEMVSGDTFSYPAHPVTLREPKSVPTL